MCSILNLLFVVNPKICLGQTPFHYAVSVHYSRFGRVIFLACAVFGIYPFQNVLFLECDIFGMCPSLNLLLVMNPKIYLGRTMLPLHYSLFGVCSFWHLQFLERAVAGMCPFWNVLFLECDVFGICPFWNVPYLTDLVTDL